MVLLVPCGHCFSFSHVELDDVVIPEVLASPPKTPSVLVVMAMKVWMNCAQIKAWSDHFWREMSTIFGSGVNNESDGRLFFKLPCIVVAKFFIGKCCLNMPVVNAIDVNHHLGAILVA